MGQVAGRLSEITQRQSALSSLKNILFWQGHRDSNPGPTVLETVALPTELYPYHQRWVCFFDVLIK